MYYLLSIFIELTLKLILQWTGLTLLFNYLIFSITVFVGMFTGNSIAQIIFTYIFNILPYGLQTLVVYNQKKILHGYMDIFSYNIWANILPMTKLTTFEIASFTALHAALYSISAAVFLVLALFLYEKRQMEKAADIIAFPVIRPVFKYGVAISCALLGGVYLSMAAENRLIIYWGYFIFSLIGYWGSQMIMDRSFKVWYAYKGYLVFTAILLLISGSIYYDVWGYERRVPSIEQVEEALVTENTAFLIRAYGNQYLSEDIKNSTQFLRGKESIKNITDFHRHMTTQSHNKKGQPVYIVYKLKNGTQMTRKYNIDYILDAHYLKPLYESIEYKHILFPLLEQEPDMIENVTVWDTRANKTHLRIRDSKEIKEIVSIFKDNLKKMPYEDIIGASGNFIRIYFSGKDCKPTSFKVHESFSAFFDWLKQYGYYDKVMLRPQNVTYVEISKVQEYIVKYAFNSTYSSMRSGKTIEIKDLDIIQELFGLCKSYNSQEINKKFLALTFHLDNESYGSAFDGYIFEDTPVSQKLKEFLDQLNITDQEDSNN